MSNTNRTCARCGHTAPMYEFGIIQLASDPEPKYYCHLTMSTGPTCYMQQNWANSEAFYREEQNKKKATGYKPMADPFRNLEEL